MRVAALYAGHRAALVQAALQADCMWWDAWLRMHRSGDFAGQAAALAGERRVFALAPRHAAGASEDAGGMDETTVVFVRRLQAQAKSGQAAGVAQFVAVNCGSILARARR